MSVAFCAAALAVCAGLGSMLPQAFAQSSNSTNPGVVPKRFEPPPTPRVEPPLIVPRIEPQAPPDGAKDIGFVLNEVLLVGNTAIEKSELLPLWRESLSKNITLTEVYEIAARITVHYRNAGYILSRAIVPPQEIENGTVTIRVIEGYIDNVIVEGAEEPEYFQIARKIEAIKESRPLRADVLERYLLLLNDLPGVSAESVLRPSPTAQGASELVIIMRVRQFNLSATLDNRGSRLIGPMQGILTANLNNLRGAYDNTEIRYINADYQELNYISVKHSELISSEGTVLSFTGTIVKTKPGSVLTPDKIEGHSFALAVAVTHPVVRTRSENLSLNLGFNALESETDQGGTRVSDDRVRSVQVGATYDFVDNLNGINLVAVRAVQGLDVLWERKSGSFQLTREDGKSDFTKFTLDLAREQNIYGGLSLLVAASGQYALSQLLASEEFGYGGENFGRGYDAFEIAGDHGAAAKAELRYGEAANLSYLESYQVYAFYDFGSVWRIDPNRLSAGSNDTAASTGAGVRFNFLPNLFGSAEVAIPLTRSPTIDRDDGETRYPRFFFRITGRI